ncbi:MAG: PaaI family thioesterase [Desulfobacteraceae bacterium]
MNEEEHYRRLERMYASAPCNQVSGAAISISKGTAELELEVRRDFFHGAGSVHGSVYFKLMDDAAFFACSSLVRNLHITTQFNVHFTRAVSKGFLRCIGEVVHRSRNFLVAESRILDQKGRQVARGSGTFQKTYVKLSPEVGYA